MLRRLGASGLLALTAIMTLPGCGANHHSIYRTQPLAGSSAALTLVDAKQRAIVTNVVGGQVRACLEESPDFASVIAQSLAATGSFGQSADPASVQAAASLAATTSEQGTTITRTQAVNLMRALLASDCFRYLDANEDVRALATPIQAVRTQRIIVSLLGIDALTGMATPRPVIIGAGGTASAGSSPAEAVVRLDNARQALQAAEGTVSTRQSAYNVLEEASPACTAIEQKAATPDQTLTAEETTKRNQCAQALSALNTAKSDRQRASENLELLQNAMASGGGGPASATATLQDGGHSIAEAARVQSEAVASVAQVVERIVTQAYAQDEFGLFCLRFIDPRERPHEDLLNACIRYLSANLNREAARAEAEARQYRLDFISTWEVMDDTAGALFDRFAQKVVSGGVVSQAALTAELDRVLQSRGPNPSRTVSEGLNGLRGIADVVILRQRFQNLPLFLQQHLAN